MSLARPLSVLVLAACTHRAPASSAPPGGASQHLEIASSGHLLITTSINGHPYAMILDTGANITSISTRAARELGIAQVGSLEINSAMVAPTGMVKSLAISGVDHADVAVAIVDIPDAIASGGDGIIGLDVLSRHDIVVDFPRREFGVYPAGTLVASRHLDLVPIDYSSTGLIMLSLTLDDRTGGQRARVVPAMLDLGAPVSVLNRSAGRLVGARGAATQISARTGETKLEPVRALVRDLGTFRRLGMANRPAVVLGADMFEDRLLAISYRDRVASVVDIDARR